jgi:hypothetical protein
MVVLLMNESRDGIHKGHRLVVISEPKPTNKLVLLQHPIWQNSQRLRNALGRCRLLQMTAGLLEQFGSIHADIS